MQDCPKHPASDAACIIEGKHGGHLAHVDGDWVSWDTINPAAEKRSKRKPSALDTQRAIASVQSEGTS